MSPEINDYAQAVWYFVKQGNRFGPITFEELKRLSASGGLSPDDLVWRNGFAQWSPARDVSGLFTPFQAPPPSYIPTANYYGGAAPVESASPAPGFGIKFTWLLVLLFLSVGILVCGFLFSRGVSINPAFLIIMSFPVGLMTWAILFAAIGRKLGWGYAALSFLAIYGSLFAGDYLGYSARQKAEMQAINAIQREFSTFTDSAKDGNNGGPRPIDYNANTEPTTKGEFGEMERFVKTFLNRMASMHNEYLAELNAIGWSKILDPERLKNDRSLAESKAMTQNAKEIVDKYREKTDAILNNVPNDISSLNLSEAQKREILSGFNRGMERSKRHIDEIWGLEARIISEFENVFTLLSTKRKSWIISNGQILFNNNSDLNRYNGYMTSIQNMVRQQEAIQKQSIEASNDLFNKFKQ